MVNNMDIGKRIKEIRISKGMTLDSLAKKLGYNTRSTVYKIENGDIKLNIEGLKRFANALEMSVDELLLDDIEMLDAKEVIRKVEEHNQVNDILYSVYGIHKEEYFDLAIIAPTWDPESMFSEDDNIILLKKGVNNRSYIVFKDDYKIAYVQCGSGASNLVDAMLCLTNANIDKIVFVGDAGALDNAIEIASVVTPMECISFDGVTPFFSKKFEKKMYGTTISPHNIEFVNKIINQSSKNNINIIKEKVFCTNSILLEYSHLDEIKTTGAKLIEMETAAFYNCLKLMNKDGIAILLVSDNSSIKKSLVEKVIEDMDRYNFVRNNYISQIISVIINTKKFYNKSLIKH